MRYEKWIRYLIFGILLAGALSLSAAAQETLRTRPPAEAPAPQTVALTVPRGTPLQIVLDEEVRVKNPGQKVHGRIARPVYAFDKLVVPAGTEVNGRIAK